jgi:hypothetical protein
MPGSGFNLPQANLVFTQQLHDFIVYTAFRDFARNRRADDFEVNTLSAQHQVAARVDRLMIQEEHTADSNDDALQNA